MKSRHAFTLLETIIAHGAHSWQLQLTVAMGRAARARVLSKFSWASIADQTLAFYRELVAHPPRESRG